MRRPTGVVTAAALLVAVVAVGVGWAVLRADEPSSAPSTSSSLPPSSTPPPASSPPPPSAGLLSPFTGRPVQAAAPVLAVKIDNVSAARPQVGLDRADIVYVEPVEGGLSRLMAIYSTRLPGQVGPVRSARESDLELLAQFGRPGLIYSGANRTVLSAIAKAAVVDLSPAREPSAYRRSASRSAPHNLLVDLRRMPEQGIGPARGIGFRFGALPAGEGTPDRREEVRYGAARTAFTWSATREQWDVSLDGEPARTPEGARVGAATVVVQHVRVTASRLRDSVGNRTPYPHTVGSGTAIVLRDGVSIQARWSRESAEQGTTFTSTTGQPLPFAAGPVWVVLTAPPG